MDWFRNKSRSLGVALVIGSLSVATLPGFVAAGSDAITFNLVIGSSCIHGRSAGNAQLNLIWKDAAGHRKAKTSVPSSSTGFWSYCSNDGDLVRIGDRVRVGDGTMSRLFVVPVLSLVIDRVDDNFKGRGPAGDYVRLYCEYVNGFEPCVLSWKLKVSSQGKWSFNPPNWFDVVGWQSMGVRWKSATGDFVWLSQHGPYVDVAIGSPVVRGATRANAIATVVLRRAGSNDVVATAVTRADPDGDFTAKFRNANGQKVKVRVGDRITSDVAPDEDWIMPNVTGDADASSDTVTGTCPENSFFVRAESGSEGDFTWPEDDGTFQLDFQFDQGDVLRVSCFLAERGDWVGRRIVAQ